MGVGWDYKKNSDSDITDLQFVFRVKYRVKVMYGVLFSSENCESAFVCMCHVLTYIYMRDFKRHLKENVKTFIL